jgi:hypothetical protein
LDAPLSKLAGDAADFLDRPADQERLVRRRGSVFLSGTDRLTTTEGQLISTLGGLIESIGRAGAAQAESLEKQLTDIKKKIDRIQAVHGM